MRPALALATLVLGLGLLLVPGHGALTPRAFEPLPTGSVTPKGWLLKQLELQAEGLSGHLSLFWADIMDSVWVGGSADGGLHERAPYWMNGIVPLAFLLKNANSSLVGGSARTRRSSSDPVCEEGVDMMYSDIDDFDVPSATECQQRCVETDACMAFVVDDCNPKAVHCWLKFAINTKKNASCRCFGTVSTHNQTVDIMQQARKYINFILAHQQPDGWLGPNDIKQGNEYWGPMNVLQSFTMYAEADPAAFKNVSAALLKYCEAAYGRMKTVPMGQWAQARGMDFALTVQWLIKHAPQGQDQMLFDLLSLIKAQTLDWETWFSGFQTGASPHGVNNAQALKSSGVWYESTGNQTLPGLSRQRLHNMDSTYGMASGMFCADEILCSDPEKKMPSRGTELCAVVESMFSYNTLFSVHGDTLFADRAERIAFNALPATWASPVGGDMWNHQYLQAVNEIASASQNPHVWTHDGNDAELYGLAPNYGCCTANFNQGWPKYANYLVFRATDGFAVGGFAPMSARLDANGSTLDIDTSYPFEDTVRFALHSAAGPLKLHIRIPAWASNATVAVNGGAAQAAPGGGMFTVACGAGATTAVLALNPSIRVEHWYSNTSISVHRGPLMFSYPISGNFTRLHQYPFESADYQVLPTTDWAVALQVDPTNPSASLTFKATGYQPGSAPFNHTHFPVTMAAKVRGISWPLEKGSAAPPPDSPACSKQTCGPAIDVHLVPYGATYLRLSELPYA